MGASTRENDLAAWMRRVEQRIALQEGSPLREGIRAVVSREAARNQTQAQQSIPWDTEQYQTPGAGIWSSGNPTVLKFPVPGWWLVQSRVAFSANATGIRQTLIIDNAEGELDRDIDAAPSASTNSIMQVFRRIFSDGTNFCVIATIQSSGTDARPLAVGERFCRVEVEYLGR